MAIVAVKVHTDLDAVEEDSISRGKQRIVPARQGIPSVKPRVFMEKSETGCFHLLQNAVSAFLHKRLTKLNVNSKTCRCLILRQFPAMMIQNQKWHRFCNIFST